MLHLIELISAGTVQITTK